MAAEQQQPDVEQVPSIGRIVHYILDEGPHAGEHRPAIIVQIWGTTPSAAVNLQVFTDSENDFPGPNAGSSGMLWKTSVSRAPSPGVLDTYYSQEG